MWLGSAGVSEPPLGAGAVPAGWPAPGTRGTHWHVPSKDKCQEASCSRDWGGSVGGNAALDADLTVIYHIFLPSPILALGTAGSGGRQAQRLGEETKRDRESMPRMCTVPTPRSWPASSHAGMLLRLRDFMGSL